jgi:5-methylthioribose kinase
MCAALLDIEDRDSLAGYLAGREEARSVGDFEHRVLAGGVSCKTVLVSFADGTEWVLKQSLEKLRVAGVWHSDPARIHREADGMRVLKELARPDAITSLIFDDPVHHVIAMTAVARPHENLKPMLLSGNIQRALFAELGELLAEIHSRSAAEPERYRSFDQGYFESLRIEPYYRATAEAEPRSAAFIGRLIDGMGRRRLSLVHGDFSPKNVLVHRDHVVLLDHEVIHWGDPAFDLGFFLTHLLSKCNHLPAHRADLMRCVETFSNRYFETIARPAVWQMDLEQMAVVHTMACLLARISGRSSLEYLSKEEKQRQREAILRFMETTPPKTIRELSEKFVSSMGVK